MRITYRTSLADFTAAYRMYQRKSIFLRYDQMIWPSVVGLCILATAAFGRNSAIRTVIEYVFIYAIALSIGLPVLRKVIPYRMYRKSRNADHEFVTEISADKVVDITPNECELNYEWSSITGFGQNARITIFCMSNGHYIFFPTAVLNPEQHDELNEFVARRGIKRWS